MNQWYDFIKFKRREKTNEKSRTNYFNNKIIFNDLQMKSADCLADGVVSVSDAVILVRYINRKCDTLPLSPDDL